jgi:hypothetical protein
LWGNHHCGCLPNTTSLVIETHYVGLTHCWELIQVSRDVDSWSVSHMLLLKVSENVCNCHCYSNHLQFFFLLCSSGLGSSFFLVTGVFVGSKSSTALLSDHLSILCRLT